MLRHCWLSRWGRREEFVELRDRISAASHLSWSHRGDLKKREVYRCLFWSRLGLMSSRRNRCTNLPAWCPNLRTRPLEKSSSLVRASYFNFSALISIQIRCSLPKLLQNNSCEEASNFVVVLLFQFQGKVFPWAKDLKRRDLHFHSLSINLSSTPNTRSSRVETVIISIDTWIDFEGHLTQSVISQLPFWHKQPTPSSRDMHQVHRLRCCHLHRNSVNVLG